MQECCNSMNFCNVHRITIKLVVKYHDFRNKLDYDIVVDYE